MTTYAARTEVTTARSRAEIERTLARYGASAFAYGWQDQRAMIEFIAYDRRVRVMLPIPSESEQRYWRTPTGRRRTPESARSEWEQDVRARWRALALVVKAKLEAVSSGIVSFEDEWLAYTVLPDGRTVAEHAQPMIADAYASGQIGEILPDYSRPALERGRS